MDRADLPKPIEPVAALRQRTLGGLPLIALAWASLATIAPHAEAFKQAGIAAIAALLLLVEPRILRLPAALVLLLASALLSSLFALHPASAWIGSVERGSGLLALAAAVLLASATARSGAASRQHLPWGAAALASLVSIYALLQTFGLDPWSWQGEVRGRPAATLGNANNLAGFLLLTLPLSWWMARARRWSPLWLALLVLQGTGLLVTGSRSAWLALGLLACAAWLWAHARDARRLLPIVLVAVLALPVLGVMRPASLLDRVELWRAGALALLPGDAVVDVEGRADSRNWLRPWIGHGPDQQTAVLDQRRGALASGREETRAQRADRAHQWGLDLLLERGLLGALAALLLLGAVLRDLIGPPGPRQHLAAGIYPCGPPVGVLWLGLAAYLLHLQAGFALGADHLLAWLWLALAWPSWHRCAADGARWMSLAGPMLAACLGVAAVAAAGLAPPAVERRVFPALASERAFEAGREAWIRAGSVADAGGWTGYRDAAGYFEQSLLLRPQDDDAAIGAASAWLESARRGGPGGRRAEQLLKGLEARRVHPVRLQPLTDLLRQLPAEDSAMAPEDARLR